jgi:hypothetical protein
VNRFAVNADYALETSQTALTEVKKIWKSSADTLTLATGWLKDHLTIGEPHTCRVAARSLPARCLLAHTPTCSYAPPATHLHLFHATDPALLAVPPPFGPQQQQQPGAQVTAAAPAAATSAAATPAAAVAAAPAAAAAAPAAPGASAGTAASAAAA